MKDRCEGVPPAEQIAALITLLGREVKRDEEARFRGAPLTASQYTIASSLAAAGSLTITELAAVGCCVPANVTALVDRLERKGLAHRLAGSKDRRVTRVELTSAGMSAVAATATRTRAGYESITAALSEADQQSLTQLLGRLYVELVEDG